MYCVESSCRRSESIHIYNIDEKYKMISDEFAIIQLFIEKYGIHAGENHDTMNLMSCIET